MRKISMVGGCKTSKCYSSLYSEMFLFVFIFAEERRASLEHARIIILAQRQAFSRRLTQSSETMYTFPQSNPRDSRTTYEFCVSVVDHRSTNEIGP